MTIDVDSQQFDSFVPVYDVVPEKWEDARQFLVEHLKKISNAVNIRKIGWLLDEELLSGEQFFPSGTNQNFRSVLQTVVNCSPLVVGLNPFPHGVQVDANFSLMQLYASATNHSAFTGSPIPNGANKTITYDANNIYINTDVAFDTCYAFFLYIQEL
jgi:hypothetical protein